MSKHLEHGQEEDRDVGKIRELLSLRSSAPTFSSDKKSVDRVGNFSLKEDLAFWKEFYFSHGLRGVAECLPKEVQLAPTEIMIMEAMIGRYGFDTAQILPSPMIHLKYQFADQFFKTTTSGEVAGLPGDQHYNTPGYCLKDGVSHLNQLGELRDDRMESHRSYRPYLKLYKEGQEELLHLRNPELIPDLALRYSNDGLSGDTLFEYMLEQRAYVEKNHQHPDTSCLRSLVDTKLGNGILFAGWQPHYRRVLIYRNNGIKPFIVRPSAIFPL
ncbi:MAG: hypothetical protein PHU71_02630 [Candidatus Gracilibacteria bacterium]|nr:hypothetical protein [Candidatus Gracilibacteria bacterium]